MIAPMVVVLDKGGDLGFEIAGEEVVFEQNAVLQGLVPALNLALSLGMARCATHVVDFPILKPFRQVAGDVARPVVGKQARPLPHRRPIAA